MIILAIDTASTLCAACVWDAAASREMGRGVEDIGKGHAERLMDVIAAAMKSAGIGYGDVGGVAVSIGPGSFTGIRVGVSAARGLALALKCASWGVTTLSAIAEEARFAHPGRAIMAAIDAKRDELYVERHDRDGHPVGGPAAVSLSDAAGMAAEGAYVLAGSGAEAIAAAMDRPVEIHPGKATADISFYARLAAGGRIHNTPPKPLYLRAPDARPQDTFALPRRVD